MPFDKLNGVSNAIYTAAPVTVDATHDMVVRIATYGCIRTATRFAIISHQDTTAYAVGDVAHYLRSLYGLR